jgi:carboxylesterase type B
VLDRTRRPFTEEDERVSAQLQAYWLNFVRGGDPNGRGLAVWRPLVPGSREVMGLGDRVGPRAVVSSDARLAAFEAYTKAGGHLSVR